MHIFGVATVTRKEHKIGPLGYSTPSRSPDKYTLTSTRFGALHIGLSHTRLKRQHLDERLLSSKPPIIFSQHLFPLYHGLFCLDLLYSIFLPLLPLHLHYHLFRIVSCMHTLPFLSLSLISGLPLRLPAKFPDASSTSSAGI